MAIHAARRREIETAAAKLSGAAGPVDPLEVAARCGVAVVACPGLSSSALYLRRGRDEVILYAIEGRTREFQRFSIAHELGHRTLHQGGLRPSGQLEREADYFAGCLLMHVDVVIEARRRHASEPLSAIAALAGDRGVSLTAAAIRYVEVIEDASIVVVAHGSSIRQWRSNAALAARLDRRFRLLAGADLPEEALARKLSKPQLSLTSAAPAGVWFDGGTGDITEHVRILGRTGTLTVVVV